MNKEDIARTWKPQILPLGFAYRDRMFQLKETIDEHVQFAISIQKNVHDVTLKINPSIFLRNPFQTEPRQEVLILASLRKDGIHFRVTSDSWWVPESLPQALEALKQHAIPWFRRWGKVEFLAEKMEAAIGERKDLIDVLEPLTTQDKQEIARVWGRPEHSQRRLAPIALYYASILHFLAGKKDMAIRRAEDWMALISPREEAERAAALAHLSALRNAN